MFCKNCGSEINDTARFCPKCGNDRIGGGQKTEKVEDNSIRFSLKPQFNMLYQILTSWREIVVLFLAAYFNTDFPIIPIGFLIIIYVVVKIIIRNMQYKSLAYNFYTTKVEYVDGFLNKEEKELKYKFVREVTMSQSILERICGIGTIKIFTNASSGGYSGRDHSSMKGRNGLYIHCVDNVQEQYRIIKEIIDEATPEDF